MNRLAKEAKTGFFKRFPPTSWPFLLAVVFLILGISFNATILTVAGGFVILLYVLIWVLWIMERTR